MEHAVLIEGNIESRKIYSSLLRSAEIIIARDGERGYIMRSEKPLVYDAKARLWHSPGVDIRNFECVKKYLESHACAER
jgi:hypothetical protein